MEDLEKLAADNGVTQEDFQALLVYTSGVLGNLANYKSFGDTKFIPAAPVDVFEKVIKLSDAYKKERDVIESLWDRVKYKVYSLTDKEKTIGFPDKVFCLQPIIVFVELRPQFPTFFRESLHIYRPI